MLLQHIVRVCTISTILLGASLALAAEGVTTDTNAPANAKSHEQMAPTHGDGKANEVKQEEMHEAGKCGSAKQIEQMHGSGKCGNAKQTEDNSEAERHDDE